MLTQQLTKFFGALSISKCLLIHMIYRKILHKLHKMFSMIQVFTVDVIFPSKKSAPFGLRTFIFMNAPNAILRLILKLT